MSDALTQEEIDALMGPGAADAGTADEIVAYNFKRPKRVPQEQIRLLYRLHESLVRKLEFTFGTLLRQIAEVSLVSVLQLTYEEFLESLASPTCFATFGVRDLPSSLAIEIPADFILTMIDRILGGKGTAAGAPRELTDLEWTIHSKIIQAVMKDYQEVWQPLRPVDFVFGTRESNPHQAQFAAANELVVVVVINMKFGENTGILHICFPFVSLKPLLHTLSPRNWLAAEDSAGGPNARETLRGHAGRTRLTLSARVEGARIAVKDLVRLAVGDVLRLGVSSGSDVRVCINGVPKLTGRPVSRGGRKAIRLTGAGAQEPPAPEGEGKGR